MSAPCVVRTQLRLAWWTRHKTKTKTLPYGSCQEAERGGILKKGVSVGMVQEFVQQGESRSLPLPGEAAQQGRSLHLPMRRCPSDASTTGACPLVLPDMSHSMRFVERGLAERTCHTCSTMRSTTDARPQLPACAAQFAFIRWMRASEWHKAASLRGVKSASQCGKTLHWDI